MGKKLTPAQLKTITLVAREIRDTQGSREKKVKVYNMKWTDAIKRASKYVLSKDEQASKRKTKAKPKAKAKTKTKTRKSK